jgi:hypothetical protein
LSVKIQNGANAAIDYESLVNQAKLVNETLEYYTQSWDNQLKVWKQKEPDDAEFEKISESAYRMFKSLERMKESTESHLERLTAKSQNTNNKELRRLQTILQVVCQSMQRTLPSARSSLNALMGFKKDNRISSLIHWVFNWTPHIPVDTALKLDQKKPLLDDQSSSLILSSYTVKPEFYKPIQTSGVGLVWSISQEEIEEYQQSAIRAENASCSFRSETSVCNQTVDFWKNGIDQKEMGNAKDKALASFRHLEDEKAFAEKELGRLKKKLASSPQKMEEKKRELKKKLESAFHTLQTACVSLDRQIVPARQALNALLGFGKKSTSFQATVSWLFGWTPHIPLKDSWTVQREMQSKDNSSSSQLWIKRSFVEEKKDGLGSFVQDAYTPSSLNSSNLSSSMSTLFSSSASPSSPCLDSSLIPDEDDILLMSSSELSLFEVE